MISSAEEVTDDVRNKITDWRSLGHELGLKREQIDRIEREQPGGPARLSKAIRIWYNQLKGRAFWEDFIRAVIGLGDHSLAKAIATEHGIDWEQFEVIDLKQLKADYRHSPF